MNCRNADILMQKSLDGALTPRDRALLDRHLSTCASCRVAWEEYRALNRATKSWISAAVPQETASEDFVQRTLQTIAASSSQAPHTHWNWKQLGLSTLAVTLALIVAAPLWPLLHPVLAPATDLLPPVKTTFSLPTMLSVASHDGSNLLNRQTWENMLMVSAPRGTTLALFGALVVNVLLTAQAVRKRSTR